MTGVMLASRWGFNATVQKLLEAGADLDLRDKVRRALHVVT
jgi:ankyrin repeat protein